MLINWFSPLPPAKTDIAHYTQRIMPILTKISQVKLWTDDSNVIPSLQRHVVIYNVHQLNWRELNKAELTFYNIGNNPVFHTNIWKTAIRHPAIVILHDECLQHLFGAIYKQEVNGKQKFLSIMASYYGPRGYYDAERFWNGELETEELAIKYPLTEFAVENAIGVVVHTSNLFNKLKDKLPVIYLPLPYLSKRKIKKEFKSKKNIYKLILFGFIGKNRRLESILNALATSSYKKYLQLNIYGKILDQAYQAYIEELIKKYNLQKQVKIHGFVSEDELDKAIFDSDLALNLRFPTMGEASGSQLRIWDNCLASVVSKVGWYATLPKECVEFVSIENEIKDLHRIFAELVHNPLKFYQKGLNGKRYLTTYHSPQNYIKHLLEFSQQVSSQHLEHLVCKYLCEKTANFFSSLSFNPDEHYLRQIATAIYNLTV